MDEPYPDNLPVVGACSPCNSSFSKDESYLAYLIESALVGSTDPDSFLRPKIRRIFANEPSIRALIQSSRQENGVMWKADVARVRNVVLKLARGHAAFECSEPMLQEPSLVSFVPRNLLSEEELSSFETAPVETVFPELGSLAFLKSVVVDTRVFLSDGWHVVQPGRYRYLVSWSGPFIVRCVLSEYLFCEVAW
ncbi:MAG TPA: hypothetical protein VLH56_09935 [Dissulfurispiraceae bacterium]|nr:hypothetical protein [Dissulfurispiraceae bacterium]